ncbi:hypothetical protein MKX03_035717 [Papaver bracteatum]|nr:hypothetical protein MKX03_035717 [Papaver bracteatum]
MERNQRPRAVFMAFGTKGDVYPIAAIAAAFASDQPHYHVILITHSAHQNLIDNLEDQNVSFYPITTPPVLSILQDHNSSECEDQRSFSLQKKLVKKEHRLQCLSTMEKIFDDVPSLDADFILINFFALEGWNLAELFHVRCIVGAPYVVPYCAPSSFERHFKEEFPLLYIYLQEAPAHMVCWKDVIHWMWPLFTEEWGVWRNNLNLSYCPLTDPVTGLPISHNWPPSPLLLYGFSREVVEFPGYWPRNVRVCGFWFPPMRWQFSCSCCRGISDFVSPRHQPPKDELCTLHASLQIFLKFSASDINIFIGLSSIGSMGFLKNPRVFLRVLGAVSAFTNYKFILFTAAYQPLDAAVHEFEGNASSSDPTLCDKNGVLLFRSRVFCFSGSIPYSWVFQRCAVAIHHGGSGSTASALSAGIPQVICPFILDQFYWAERMFWLGVAPPPLQANCLLQDNDDDASISKAVNSLLNAIKSALLPEVKVCASQIADKINLEDGIQESLKVLKEEIVRPSSNNQLSR